MQLARVIDAISPRAASLVLVLALVACGGPRQEQLAGGIDLLAGESVELPSREPLGSGEPRGRLCLTPRAPFRVNVDSLAIRTPYQRFARPFALAVRADGGVDSLTEASVRANEDLCLTTRAASARPPWRAVRLVSGVDLSLDRVAWHDR